MSIGIERDGAAHQTVDRPQVVDPVEMVGMRMSEHRRVDPPDAAIEELLAQIRGSIDEDDDTANFHQDRYTAATIAGVGGIAAAPISPDHRYAGRRAATQESHLHRTGALALPNRRKKLALVVAAKCCSSMPFSSATAAAVAAT